MPRKLDNDTRVHFRTYEDDKHAQKRAFCLHCHTDACADNIQRMKNHLLRCDAYLNSQGPEPEPLYHLQHMDGPVAPDAHMAPLQPPQPQPPPPPPLPVSESAPGLSHPPPPPPPPPLAQEQVGRATPPMPLAAPLANNNSSNNNNNGGGSSSSNAAIVGTPSTAQSAKSVQSSLNNVRIAMGRSTRRLESLEAVLKTQVQDGMHNAATHVRAAIRDERDRLFKLSQTLVKQETRAREAQNPLGAF